MGKYGFCPRFRNVAPCAGRFPRIETVNTNTNTTADIDTAAKAVVALIYDRERVDRQDTIIIDTPASFDGSSCPRVEAEIKRIIALVGDTQFVRHDRWGPDDGYEGFTPGGQSNRTMTGLDVIEWLRHDIYEIGRRLTRSFNGNACCYSILIPAHQQWQQTIWTDINHCVNSDEIVEELSAVKCPTSFRQMVNQCLIDNDECTLYTAERWAEIERQKMRKECEAAASELMHKHGLDRIDCLGAIKAIYADLDASEEAYEAHMDPEARLHRYGMHRGSGSDAYHQDEDQATISRMHTDDQLHRLLTYMRLYFPLLWSEWEATKGK